MDNTILRVNYGDMPGMNKKTQLLFKNLEWGINIKSNTMYLTYEIEQDTLYAVMTRFDNFIQHNEGRDINLIISSYGGDVYSMLGIIDYFKTLPVKVNTHCYGACMSAAAVILSCGTGERTMTQNSTVMVHEGSAFEAGKTTDVMKGVDHLKTLQKEINQLMGEVTDKDERFWELTQRNDTYLNAEQCLEYGLIDKIV